MSFSIEIGGKTFSAGGAQLLIAGPCMIESEQHAMTMAKHISQRVKQYADNFLWVFKASFDKANRSSGDTPRGPGMDEGLRILERIKNEFNVPVLTDIHESYQAKPVAEVVDILQIPAFLCRQTDLLLAAAATGRVVNVKKGQFVAPHDMGRPIEKIREAGNPAAMITERGTSFGYNNLVVDYAGLYVMRQHGAPIIFDTTHCVQLPGGMGKVSGGRREVAPYMAKAAAAFGVDGFFMEVHDNPDQALSDGPNQLNLPLFEELLPRLVAVREAVS
ncbi:3-deoxy-8-phosphooctulonate synthase [Acanthopleuribacter pedis]|uniref:2-dehydro-3-deoxyphosphooctonate aldolase n=1 Tax=Acanthopleuribacter pedis TaxID=442870 RepID=A0A8J7U2B6_9BACT|nr:3-deoxy-8-phosphooctulonate synthase [Acanthopleuribacter pedis]MBO1317534.1 3-deoxy-8-phosphooctulonate synthase [Acanthopleuribacter pedis]